ncbi:hypothetical protein L1987_32859 [Smallanthus sonchifolius]|uniref:Uncharacterized protein n=1 Tax=Smallanthus sonchifolius TaxID=185202 RepID=A0ACB9HPE3_9ASTR|nr:hypothetical protein L1987_32859 [Smallanthus sonchifolius]
MPQEHEVTSYASCTSVSTNSLSDSENSANDLVEMGNDSVIAEEEELSEVVSVTKNANIPREKCILVELDAHVDVKPKVQTIKPKLELPNGFKKVQFVKSENMQQEVSKIDKISNKEFINHKIFKEAEAYERESADPFFKRTFVKKSQ